MKFQKVLEELEELFKKWGLSVDDWILIAHYAMKLQGYKVKLRKRHLNTIINKDKLPWKVREGYEVFPQKGSRWAREFSRWMRSTGFDTDLIVHNSRTLKKVLKDTVLHQLPNKEKVRLLTMGGNLKTLDEYLIHCREEEVGEEKGRYLLGRLEDMRRAAKEKGDKKAVLLANKILGKYKYLRKKEKISLKQVRELKGMPAFRGKVKGRVRIVLGKGDKIGKMEKGEILVTKMTSARLAFIMNKIKGIVTDDGGALCHAAIISREFEVPCIVGTKIATRVLKDGDLVEVDAEKGIVRKLEK